MMHWTSLPYKVRRLGTEPHASTILLQSRYAVQSKMARHTNHQCHMNYVWYGTIPSGMPNLTVFTLLVLSINQKMTLTGFLSYCTCPEKYTLEQSLTIKSNKWLVLNQTCLQTFCWLKRTLRFTYSYVKKAYKFKNVGIH